MYNIKFLPENIFWLLHEVFPLFPRVWSADRLVDRFPLKLCFGDSKLSWKHNNVYAHQEIILKKIYSLSINQSINTSCTYCQGLGQMFQVFQADVSSFSRFSRLSGLIFPSFPGWCFHQPDSQPWGLLAGPGMQKKVWGEEPSVTQMRMAPTIPWCHYITMTITPLYHHRDKMPTMQGLYCEKRQRFHWRDMRDDGGLMQDKQRCIHKL